MINGSSMQSLKELKELEQIQIKTVNNYLEEKAYYNNILDNDLIYLKDGWYCVNEFNGFYYGMEDKKRVINYIKDKLCFKYDLFLSETQKKIQNIEENINNMLKYFNKNLSNLMKGKVIKLLSKTYSNPFYSYGNGLKSSLKLYEIINYAIENNLRFYLQYKTLENECIKIFDSDLNKWV